VGGWLVAWRSDGRVPDAGKWRRSLRVALRYGGQWTEHRVDGTLVGTWKRGAGEFPCSGELFCRDRAVVGWVGQCIDDGGDASPRAAALLAGERLHDRELADLNGPFAAVMARDRPFEVRVVTDRHRHYPVYVHRGSGVVVASTEIRCVVPWLARVRIDQDSVDMLLRCGELIDRMTMLHEVDLLPPGTVLTDTGTGPRERRYWTMCHHGSSGASIAETADVLADRIRTAVRRIERLTPRLGVTLSGGLDSRMILDLCEHPEAVPSFTWGLPGCRDIRCASRFAALVKSPHTVKEWDVASFPPLWERGVDLTAGSFGIDSMFMLPFVALLAASCDVVLNGLAGDAMLGGNFLKYSWLREPDIERLGALAWRWRVSPAEDLLVDGLTGRAPGPSSAGSRWVASVAARSGARPVDRQNAGLYETRVFRFTNSGTMLLRSGVESHAPFWDRDFVDAAIAVRQEHKYKHRLYLEVMKRAAPRAASVPWQRTNLAPARGFLANLAAMAAHRLALEAGARLGVDVLKSYAVAAPAAWLRAGWSPRVEEVLAEERLSARGLVRPGVVRNLWRAHLAGEDHTRQLGALVSIELFARQVIDASDIDREGSSREDASA